MKIGVVIPAFNEQEYLERCLIALHHALTQCHDLALEIEVLVVLDSCSDRSLDIVKTFKVNYLECAFQCVGQTRDLGIRYFIEKGMQWIACTDADSEVAPDWFIQQSLHQPTDVICGVVEIQHWQHLSDHVRQDYLNHYHDQMQHAHIHGANLCFSIQAYLRAGGFEPVSCHEDVSLVEKMKTLGMSISWSNKLRVVTSSRLVGRTPQGFATFLSNLC